MTMPTVRLMRVPGSDPNVALPSYESAGAAGADLRANLPSESRASGFTLAPGARALIPTGLAAEIPHGYEMQVRARSGLALRHGLALVNAPGTVDSDYRGEIGVIVVNLGQTDITIQHGDRIAQAVIAPVTIATFTEVQSLDQTTRGAGGFGSTGRG